MTAYSDSMKGLQKKCSFLTVIKSDNVLIEGTYFRVNDYYMTLCGMHFAMTVQLYGSKP